jgi:transcriptional regulator with XRE-family HTH domain
MLHEVNTYFVESVAWMKRVCYNLFMVIGEFIKQKRDALNMSQRRLATKSGVSNATISRIENKGVMPDTDTINKLAPVLKTTVAEMLNCETAPISMKEQKLIDAYAQAKNSNDPKVKAMIAAVDKLLGIDE